MQIRELMSQYVEVINPDANLTDVVQKMSRGDVGGVLPTFARFSPLRAVTNCMSTI
jgi:predicted transcriptional regulator